MKKMPRNGRSVLSLLQAALGRRAAHTFVMIRYSVAQHFSDLPTPFSCRAGLARVTHR
jgi:hypothetical protein